MAANKGLWPWFFQRITGVVLVVGLIVHFVVLHYLTHRPVTVEKIADRLSQPGWVTFDCIILAACVYHALNGLHSIVLDFDPPPIFRRVVTCSLWVVGFASAAAGVANLIPLGQ